MPKMQTVIFPAGRLVAGLAAAALVVTACGAGVETSRASEILGDLQVRIDALAAAGGGRVNVPHGVHRIRDSFTTANLILLFVATHILMLFFHHGRFLYCSKALASCVHAVLCDAACLYG